MKEINNIFAQKQQKCLEIATKHAPYSFAGIQLKQNTCRPYIETINYGITWERTLIPLIKRVSR